MPAPTQPWTVSPWLDEIEAPTEPLRGELEVDVAIVGAGLAGCSSALALRREGLTVAVLEREVAGYGASGRYAGHLTPTIGKDLPTLVLMLGRERARALVALAEHAVEHAAGLIATHGIDCDYEAVGNVLAGKEWKLGPEAKDRTLMAGFRYSLQGGQYYTPIDLASSIAAGTEKEGSPAWSEKAGAVHKLDIVASYRVGRPKVSHEFKLDVQNVLNAATPVYYYYNDRTQRIDHVPQLALLPVMQYTLRF